MLQLHRHILSAAKDVYKTARLLETYVDDDNLNELDIKEAILCSIDDLLKLVNQIREGE